MNRYLILVTFCFGMLCVLKFSDASPAKRSPRVMLSDSNKDALRAFRFLEENGLLIPGNAKRNAEMVNGLLTSADLGELAMAGKR